MNRTGPEPSRSSNRSMRARGIELELQAWQAYTTPDYTMPACRRLLLGTVVP